MTGQQMCETIAWTMERHYGETRATRDIWDASPTGELLHVAVLFEQACDYIRIVFGGR